MVLPRVWSYCKVGVMVQQHHIGIVAMSCTWHWFFSCLVFQLFRPCKELAPHVHALNRGLNTCGSCPGLPKPFSPGRCLEPGILSWFRVAP